MSLGCATLLTTASRTRRPTTISCSSTTAKRWAHSVRLIVTKDLPDGQTYQDDVVNVRAGYARNYLIPQKFAVYATRENFKRLDMKDPDMETVEERRLRLEREAQAGDDQDLKAADLLKHYLRNKVLKIWRNVDPEATQYNAISPGVVKASNVRNKLSRQLKIDLEPQETIHILPEAILHSTITEKETEKFMASLGDPQTPCTTQIRQLGQYLVRLSLRGGYSLPLKMEVVKR